MDENNGSFKNIEPIPDASTSLQDITEVIASSYYFHIVKYKDNYYKVKGSLDDGSILGISKISIDTNTFGVQDIGDGDTVLVTPSTPDYLIHGNFNGPGTYTLYNETTGLHDFRVDGYKAMDADYDRYYDDTSGALVGSEPAK